MRSLSWLPAVALSVAFTTLVLLWDPHVRDLAAQTFRTELFERGGFSIWNGSWYGGHYTLTYSVLGPPVAALIGPRMVGALSVVLSAYLFDRLVREHWGESAHWATLWFGVGAVSLLVAGQLTFAMGVAFGLLALRFLQRRRQTAAMVAAVGCALASPVAAVFLGGVVLAAASAGGVRRGAIAVGAIAVGVVFCLNLAFPESGEFPFAFTSYIGVPLWCAGALLLTRSLPSERGFRAAVWAYLLASTAALLLPNPLGGNAIRLGALFGGPVLAAILLTRRPRINPFLVALVLVGSLYWQLMAGIRAVAESDGDHSTTAAYYHPLRSWLNDHAGHTSRIEVPPTANHWEAAYLAPSFGLARGWLRQLDSTRDEIFYDERLTHTGYRRWLERNAVRYVALPDAHLDYSARAERALIKSEPSYLRLRWTSSHWRVYEVRRPGPMVVGDGQSEGRIATLGPQSFAVSVSKPGRLIVREHYTPFWAINSGAACVEAAGNWTALDVTRPGMVRVGIDFTPGRALQGVLGGRGDC
jgi:MFS family permease